MDAPESYPTETEFTTAVGTEADRVPSYKSSAASGAQAGVSSTGSVPELLECPVCTNSVYPPIHQVFSCYGHYFCLHFEAFRRELKLRITGRIWKEQ